MILRRILDDRRSCGYPCRFVALFGDPRLSPPSKRFFELTAHEGHKIALSPISFMEVAYLVEKSGFRWGI